MKRTRLRTALLIPCLGILTGCWDRTEINDLSLVMASGLDLAGNGQVNYTLQIALPPGISNVQQSGGGGKAKRPVTVISHIGQDGEDALDKMQEQLSRTIYFGHRGILIFGEEYARHGLDQVVDKFMREPTNRYNSFVLTTHGATVQEVLNAKYALEQIPGTGMSKIQTHDIGVSIQISEFLDDISKSGIMPVTGAIRLVKDASTGETTFRIDEAAVYYHEKLVGFLPENEMRMVQIWKGKGKRIKITAQAQPKEEGYKGTIGFQISKAAVKVKTKNKNGKPEATVAFKITGSALENDTKLDLSKNLPLVNRVVSDEVHKTVTAMVRHVQKEMKSDIFGIGESFHVQHPYLWKQIANDWGTIFPDVPIAIEVDVKTDGTGRTTVPAQLKKKDIPPPK
jgi:spore germination protein KC